jgi:hypothetical protein
VELLTLLEVVTTDEIAAPSFWTCCWKQRMAVLLELGPEVCSLVQPGVPEEGEIERCEGAAVFASAWAFSIWSWTL